MFAILYVDKLAANCLLLTFLLTTLAGESGQLAGRAEEAAEAAA